MYVGRGSLPVPQRNGLHDGIQSSSGAERVRPDVPIIPRIPIAPNTRINVQLTSVCCFQSRCHGLLLRLHLGRHHPGVPHTYPSTTENSVCVCVCANVHPVTLIRKSKACFDCKFLCDIYLEGTLLEVQTLNM